MAVIKLKDVVLALGASILASVAGTLLGGKQGEVYRSLNLPWYAPPGLVFPIVWSALYLLLALAAYLVLTARAQGPGSPPPPGQRGALALHFLSLALTALWPFLFFRLRLFTAAFFLIVLMLALGVATAVRFYRIRPWAGLCYLPYLAWLAFALLLTGAVDRLN